MMRANRTGVRSVALAYSIVRAEERVRAALADDFKTTSDRASVIVAVSHDHDALWRLGAELLDAVRMWNAGGGAGFQVTEQLRADIRHSFDAAAAEEILSALERVVGAIADGAGSAVVAEHWSTVLEHIAEFRYAPPV